LQIQSLYISCQATLHHITNRRQFMRFSPNHRLAPLVVIFIFVFCFCFVHAQEATAQNQEPTNTPPRIFGTPPTSVIAGEEYYFKPDVEDDEQDSRFTFTIQNKPNWAFFSALTGELTGTPTTQDIATSRPILIGVIDNQDAKGYLDKFSIQVLPQPDQPPIFSSKPSQKAIVGKRYYYQLRAYQPANRAESISFQAENLPYWLEYNQTSHSLSGTPQSGDEGVAEDIKLTATNQNDISQELVFAITITNPNSDE